jgi:hypothetical protein
MKLLDDMETYRGCVIEPSFIDGIFDWYFDGENRFGWFGCGLSVEECKKQIDEAYENDNW